MIVDTSAWIEFLRGTGSHVHHTLRNAIRDRGDEIISPDIVLAELTAGARDDHEAQRLTRMLFTYRVEPLTIHDDALAAGSLYRRCRRSGITVRGMSDCLIAAVALRLDQPVLTADRDFDGLASATRLRLVG